MPNYNPSNLNDIFQKMTSKKYKFCDFCNKLEEIRQAQKQETKIQIFQSLVNNFRQNDPNEDVEEVYSVLRLILPQYDKNRTTYGMKEVAIGKIVASTFDLIKESEDYKMLYLNDYPEIKRSKDYAYVVSNILYRYNSKSASSFTIADINDALTNISQSNSSEIFRKLLVDLSPKENKWLIRIILKEVRIYLDPEIILSTFHPNAPKFFQSNNNLYVIIKNCIKNAEENVEASSKYLFQFIRPMLSERASKKLFERININGYQVEEKFDGERFQFHYDHTTGEYKWFSRQGNVYDVFDQLTTKIKPLLANNVCNFILDGEMVGFNVNTRKYGTKGFNYDIKKVKETSVYQPCFIVFDVLFCNNHNLMQVSLANRRKKLEEILPIDEDGVIIKSRLSYINQREDLVRYFNSSIEKHLEGIVVKDPSSVYLPNKRTPNWIKLKVDYFNGLIEDLDLIIIGGFYGEGRQAGKVATFLLGVLDLQEEGDYRYISVGESGTGLTDPELRKLQYKLNEHWQKVDKNTQLPSDVKWGKLKPNVWIRPEHSVILEMRASELHRSDNFLTTHTLRFPRIIRVRYDKPVDQCMTLSEFEELIGNWGNTPVVKLFKRLATEDDLLPATNHQIKKIKTEAEEIEVKTNTLNGREFFVLSGTENLPMSEVKKMILENGGKLAIEVKNTTTCMLAGNVTFDVKTEIKLRKRDVVNIDWLLDILENKEYRDWLPNEALVISPEKQKEFHLLYDEYGDSYTEFLDVDKLEQILPNVPTAFSFMDR